MSDGWANAPPCPPLAMPMQLLSCAVLANALIPKRSRHYMAIY